MVLNPGSSSNVLSRDEEGALVRELADLPFKPFDFHGYLD
jgi:hypothetical protein